MKTYLQQTTSAAPLSVFRIVFGLLIFAGVVRFWSKGWIEQLYIEPRHYFPFYGFEFVQPLGAYTYLLFAMCGTFALFVALGLFYRFSAIGLFTTFTYIELIDKSTYLNHYYFISMICLILVVLPANVYFSLDACRKKEFNARFVPLWNLHALKFFVCLLYFFAGLAKVNSDWLIEAQPLRTWLPAKSDLPIIGPMLSKVWVAYFFSWAGCLYDLSIPLLLLNYSTRLVGYCFVIIFHALTAMLFPIGMFPYIMIATGLIFFSSEFHQNIINRIGGLFKVPASLIQTEKSYVGIPLLQKISFAAVVLFFIIQVLLPFRYMIYPGELFWTEEGYRFSWRVMLMEKAGAAQFIVRDANGKVAMADNSEFLTRLQEKMVATQPDMILQYAHILRDHYTRQGFIAPEVYVDSYVTLNGRLGKPLISSQYNLAEERESFKHKNWIMPFHDEIKGF